MFTILEGLMELDGARISELGEYIEFGNSTVHRHLSTLHELGYVVKDGDVYHVGFRFLDFGEFARERKQLYRVVEPKVEKLASMTEERCQFIVHEHGQGVYLYVGKGENAVQTDSRVGKRVSLHATSSGKSILAYIRDETLDQILNRQGLPAATENTITDETKLRQELADIRDRGYAFSNEEHIGGLRSVGVPLFVADGRVAGGLSVSGPSERMRGDWYHEEIPSYLLGAANEIELKLKYETNG